MINICGDGRGIRRSAEVRFRPALGECPFPGAVEVPGGARPRRDGTRAGSASQGRLVRGVANTIRPQVWDCAAHSVLDHSVCPQTRPVA
ncbi:hypothetical protein GCM10023196_077480 [Actinoallomurus vinaceus]|uniref:Uncharacterized protein n=1 Tax=Actinoallomurus vinaceus TaxID=1080074 RepID=A0ABP8UNG9_9ACTN